MSSATRTAMGSHRCGEDHGMIDEDVRAIFEQEELGNKVGDLEKNCVDVDHRFSVNLEPVWWDLLLLIP